MNQWEVALHCRERGKSVIDKAWHYSLTAERKRVMGNEAILLEWHAFK